MDSNNTNRLLTAAEAAERLGVPVKRLRQAIRTGALPAYRVGEWWRVREVDVQGWLADQRYVPPAQRPPGLEETRP